MLALKIRQIYKENDRHKTNREALAVLSSVIKDLGSGDSTQEVDRNTRLRLVFPHTLLSCSCRFLRSL